MELWVGALNLGLLYSFMAIGMFITSRMQNFPDITVDGSFATGAGVTAVLIVAGWHPLLALAVAFVAGGVAGMCTGLIHTSLRTNGLLSGIIVMIGLYSINLHIMGRSNIPLLNTPNLVVMLGRMNPGMHPELWLAVCLAVIVALVWAVVSMFLRTDFGVTLRATGDNEAMATASGVNVNAMKVFSIAFANALVGFSGGLVAQYQGFADIGMGIGVVVAGLAAVIIGESVIRVNARPMQRIARMVSPIGLRVFSAIAGSVVFRFMIAFALFAGMNPIDLKLLTALFVLATIAASTFHFAAVLPRLARVLKKRGVRVTVLALIALCAVAVVARWYIARHDGAAGRRTIAVVQFTDNGLLDMTREGLVEELATLGYKNGENCDIILENANGDMPTVNNILDKFEMNRADIIVVISTPCTQAAIARIKTTPVVFATVANPFLLHAGKSDTDHLPNVTGVYGAVDMDSMLAFVRAFLPGPLRVGALWDAGQANSVYNVNRLQDAAKKFDYKFEGATITNSSEVYEAARSVAQRGIHAFTLPPDNIVYSAFESVVKAASVATTPVFTCDVERLGDGACAVYGYDYRTSGRQAAALVDRILKGEKPAGIPFEKYRTLTIGYDERVTKSCGIAIPDAVRSMATTYIDADGRKHGGATTAGGGRKVALILFNDVLTTDIIANALQDELRRSGVLTQCGLQLDVKNAQNDFSIAQSLVQNVVEARYDYIITLSTPMLQAAVNGNRAIPHVFGYVTDPYRVGAATSPTDHRANVTGVATPQPVESTVRMMRELFPAAKTIGMVWNPAEFSSEACMDMARPAARKYGFTLLEATVNGTGEVLDAARSLVNRNIDIFFTSGDNTVLVSLPPVAAMMRARRIPFITNTPVDVERGALIGRGADYAAVGAETARMAIRVFRGEAPASIPIEHYVPETTSANLKLAAEYGLHFPAAFVTSLSSSIK